jgi:hypothetical protein
MFTMRNPYQKQDGGICVTDCTSADSERTSGRRQIVIAIIRPDHPKRNFYVDEKEKKFGKKRDMRIVGLSK